MTRPHGPSPAGVLTALGIGAFALLCCGAPLLIAGGALTGVGAVLGNPWVIGGGGALVFGVVVWRVVHHRRAACRPPQQRD